MYKKNVEWWRLCVAEIGAAATYWTLTLDGSLLVEHMQLELQGQLLPVGICRRFRPASSTEI